MKVRRIHAPDMRQAIRRVREEQGPDAVILSSKHVDGGVEVLAAIDFDEAWIEQQAARPVHVAAAPRSGARDPRERARWEPPEPPRPRPAPRPEPAAAAPEAMHPVPAPAPAPTAEVAEASGFEAVRAAVARAEAAAAAGAALAPPPPAAGPVSAPAAADAGAAESRQQPPVLREALAPEPPRADPAIDGFPGLDDLEADLERARALPPRSSAAAEPEPAAEGGIEALRRELQSMRGLLQAELAALAGDDYARRQPVRAQLARRLEKLGIDTNLSRRLADEIRHADSAQEAWRDGLSLLARRIPVSERDLLLRGGVVALLGPTGVGKTSTAVKLAAAFVARHGRPSVALVAADSDRLGAERELLAIGQKLGIYTLVASGAEELRDALASVADRRLVLVDTAGMGYRDPRLTEQARLLSAFPEIEPWLVLAANAQRSTLEATIRRFGVLAPRGCVLTKIDETTSLGEALGAAMACGMPLNFATDGQGLEDHLHVARGDRLVTRMVALAREHAPRREDGARSATGPAATGPAAPAVPASNRRQETVHG